MVGAKRAKVIRWIFLSRRWRFETIIRLPLWLFGARTHHLSTAVETARRANQARTTPDGYWGGTKQITNKWHREEDPAWPYWYNEWLEERSLVNAPGAERHDAGTHASHPGVPGNCVVQSAAVLRLLEENIVSSCISGMALCFWLLTALRYVRDVQIIM